MSRRIRRVVLLATILGATLLISGCKFEVGCKVVHLLEPGEEPYWVDESACDLPPPVIPEVPLTLLLPLMAGATIAAVFVVRRRVAPRP